MEFDDQRVMVMMSVEFVHQAQDVTGGTTGTWPKRTGHERWHLHVSGAFRLATMRRSVEICLEQIHGDVVGGIRAFKLRTSLGVLQVPAPNGLDTNTGIFTFHAAALGADTA